jgi:hypothetical protein
MVAKWRRIGGQVAVNRRGIGAAFQRPKTAAPLDRNENSLVSAFCSFLMKADLGEAGQDLLIPHWQQQIFRGLNPANRRGTGGSIITKQVRACRADLNSK